MIIVQGEKIRYGHDAWNIQVSYENCDIKNKQLLSVRNDSGEMIGITCGESKIEAVILFDARETPIKLTGFPVDFDNVSILICNTQNRIAMYINEMLHDEDWPLGKVLLDGGECALTVGSWEIHNDFSIAQSNSDRCGTITKAQGWRPDGHNTGVGDCMPFSHDGTFHLFYLFDRRGHRSKWGLGAHQWAHISTKDLISWTEHPMAISVDEQYEGSICTGSLIFHNGLYYAYYAVRMSDGSAARMSWATSEDCIHFVKSNKYYELEKPYDLPSARDPMVMIDKDGAAHMFVTTSIKTEEGNKGCLAHLISSNLQSWTAAEPSRLWIREISPSVPTTSFLTAGIT